MDPGEPSGLKELEALLLCSRKSTEDRKANLLLKVMSLGEHESMGSREVHQETEGWKDKQETQDGQANKVKTQVPSLPDG